MGETIRWSSPASFAKMLKRLYEEQQLNCGQMDTGGLNMAQVLQLDELKSKDCALFYKLIKVNLVKAIMLQLNLCWCQQDILQEKKHCLYFLLKWCRLRRRFTGIWLLYSLKCKVLFHFVTTEPCAVCWLCADANKTERGSWASASDRSQSRQVETKRGCSVLWSDADGN